MEIEIRGGGKQLDQWFDKWVKPCNKYLFPQLRGSARLFGLKSLKMTFYAWPVPFDALGSADIIDGKAIIWVYLANHKKRPQIRRTALHELYHIYQLQNGYPADEKEAELFAWQGIISS